MLRKRSSKCTWSEMFRRGAPSARATAGNARRRGVATSGCVLAGDRHRRVFGMLLWMIVAMASIATSMPLPDPISPNVASTVSESASWSFTSQFEPQGRPRAGA